MADWLPGYNKRLRLSVDSSLVSADVADFTLHLRLASDAGITSADLTTIFDDLKYVTDGEYKIAVTLVDGTTQIAVEIAMWDWANEKAHLWVGPVDLSAGSSVALYLYWNASRSANTLYVGDAWNNDPSAPWDASYLGVWHMGDGPALTERADELSGLPTDASGSAVWQGIAVDEVGGSWYLISSEGPSGAAGAPSASDENVLRKYGIASKTEQEYNDTAYTPQVDFKFSTGAVIDGKLYITVRSNLGAEPETWAHVASYNLSTLAQIDDQDVAFGSYAFPEGVAKHSIDGATTYWWVMFGGRGSSGTADGKKCVLVRYDYPGWANPVAYELFDSIPANKFGLQDVKWISDTDFIGTIHDSGPPLRRGYVEQWHWNGSGFDHVRRWAVPVDSGANLLGQGLVDLAADATTWYLAGRHSDRLVECKMDPHVTFGSLHCPDTSPNTDKPDGQSSAEATSPTQQADDKTGYGQDFDFAASEYLDCGQSSNLNPADAFTIEVVISVDAFQAADGGRDTLVYLQRGIYLQVRGDGANANKVAVFLTGAGDTYWFSSALSTSTRYTIRVTWDGTTVRLYIDGVEDTGGDFPVTQSGTISYTGTDKHGIGAELIPPSAPYRFFDGQQMEVRVMNEGRSDADALASYHNNEDTLITWAALEIAPVMPGGGVVIKFRDPYSPHRELGEARAVVGSLAYGFVLNRASRATFKISRGDALVSSNPDALALGRMVTLERSDGLLPWVGYITQTDMDTADPEASFICTDWAGTLFERARTAKGWAAQELSSGELIRRVHEEADARGEPPLPCDLDTEAGPAVPYTPKMETFLAFLRDMAARTGWEWAMRYSVGATVGATLKWTGSIGFDRSGEVAFQQGRHFQRARLTRSIEGHISAAVAVGGTGAFGARPAAQVNQAGRQDSGIAAQKSGFGPPNSPALAGTRVLVDPVVTTTDALLASARSTFTSPDYVKERPTLSIVESTIDMKKIELGSRYSVKFTSLDLGLGYERVVRVVAIDLSESGIMQLVVEVQ
jgi:hypothetical protein